MTPRPRFGYASRTSSRVCPSGAPAAAPQPLTRHKAWLRSAPLWGLNDEDDRLVLTRVGPQRFGGPQVATVAAGLSHSAAVTEGG